MPSLRGVPLHPTSGSTGLPKIALRPGFAALEEARHYTATLDISADDYIVAIPPMSHAYGYGMCVMVPLLTGANIVSLRRSETASISRALIEHRVTIYPTVPVTLDLLLLAGAPGLAVPRLITTAGAPLPARVAVAVQRHSRTTPRPVYGTTETGIISGARPDHDPAAAGCVGPPMHGVSVKLEPTDRGADEWKQGLGQVWVSSSSMMAGYLSTGGIDRSRIVDGWFDTGDLAQIGKAGDIVLKGRETDVINAFGHKVLPSEVEEAIGLIPQVVEAKAYGATNRLGSSIVKVAVVASDGLSAADVLAHCERHLAPYKRPAHVTMLDRLPRSPSGKIVVSQLP